MSQCTNKLNYKLFIIGSVQIEDRLEFGKCMDILTSKIDREKFQLIVYVDADGNTLGMVREWAQAAGFRSIVEPLQLGANVDFFIAIIFWDGKENIASKLSLLERKQIRIVRTDIWC